MYSNWIQWNRQKAAAKEVKKHDDDDSLPFSFRYCYYYYLYLLLLLNNVTVGACRACLLYLILCTFFRRLYCSFFLSKMIIQHTQTQQAMSLLHIILGSLFTFLILNHTRVTREPCWYCSVNFLSCVTGWLNE